MAVQHNIKRNTTTNDVTGDRIQTRGVLSNQGRKNFDNIDWGKWARDKALDEAQGYANHVCEDLNVKS